jgi:hypothetical protein
MFALNKMHFEWMADPKLPSEVILPNSPPKRESLEAPSDYNSHDMEKHQT